MILKRSEKVLGSGGFGVVYQGFWGSTPVAIKRLQLIHVESNEKKEEEALRNLKHPNVIKMFHAESDANFRLEIRHEILIFINLKLKTKKIQSDILRLNCVKLRWTSYS